MVNFHHNLLLSRHFAFRGVPSESLAVVAGNAQLDFSWTAPTDDGEDLAGTDSILDYVVEYSSDAGVTWTAHTPNPTTTSTTVSGLTGGVGYLLRVAARNARGQGDLCNNNR